jgi:hypothetical protein
MMLLWTTSDRWASRAIRWASYSDFSHFAVSFDEDEDGAGIVFHSGPRGTELVYMREFLKTHRIVHALELWDDLPLEREEKIYKAILATEAGREYDYGALAWWAWRALLRRTIGKPIPPINEWQSSARRLCTGIAPAVMSALGIELKKKVDFEMIELDKLYYIFWHTNQFVRPKKIPQI